MLFLNGLAIPADEWTQRVVDAEKRELEKLEAILAMGR